MAAYDDWLDQHISRSIDRQRAQVETAKLLVTFATGVAAALVSASLQVHGKNWQNLVASSVFAASVIATVAAVLRDRLTEADRDQVATQALSAGLTDVEILRELRAAALAAWNVNETVVRGVRRLVAVQLLLAGVASSFAIWSMIWA